MKKNAQILLYVGANSFFKSQYDLAIFFKKNGYEIFILFDKMYPTIKHDLELCKKDEIKIIQTFDNFSKKYINILNIKYLLFRLFRKLDKILFQGFFNELTRSAKAYKFYLNLISAYNFELLIMVSDLVQYDSGILIKAFHKTNIKVLTFPLFAANFKEALISLNKVTDSKISKTVYKFLIHSKLFSKWVIDYKDRYFIRLPFIKVLVREIMRTAPSNPWSINSGKIDLMCVEGKAVKQLFINYNTLDTDKIIITGSLATDKLMYSLERKNELTQAIYIENGFSIQKKLALVAFPPDMFDTFTPNEFETYEEMINFWIENIFCLTNYNILFTIHPSVEKSQYKWFVDKGCKIVNSSTIDVIGLCDLYIASISATIQWAIASGKPVINFDVYDTDYDDYKEVKAVLYAKTKNEFKNLLHNIDNLKNLKYYENMQNKNAPDWAIQDTKSHQRIIEIIESNLK